MNRFLLLLIGISAMGYLTSWLYVKEIPLTNGYTVGSPIHRIKNRPVFIFDEHGTRVIENVMGFKVHGDSIQGWYQDESHSFFVIDTKSDQVQYFNDVEAMNRHLKLLGMQDFHMRDEVTFWDLKENRKSLDD